MGLPREVQNLVILTFAEQTNRSFFHHGVAVRPTLDRLDDELELREQALPPAEAWDRARERAAALFGLTPPEVLNAANVDRLVGSLLAPARAAAGPLARLVRTLEAQLITYGGAANDADRLVTARSAMALLAEVEAAGDGSKIVEALARAEVRTSEAAMARTLATAAELEAFLAGFDWQSLEALDRLQDHRRAAGRCDPGATRRGADRGRARHRAEVRPRAGPREGAPAAHGGAPARASPSDRRHHRHPATAPRKWRSPPRRTATSRPRKRSRCSLSSSAGSRPSPMGTSASSGA